MNQLSIKSKLIFAFTVVALVATLNALVQYHYNRKVEEIDTYAKKVESLNELVLKTQMYHSRFVMYDLKSGEFYENGASENLHLLNASVEAEFKNISALEELALSQKESLSKDLDDLRNELEQLNLSFGEFQKLNLLLGFEDYGKMGNMRIYAHILEDRYSNCIPKGELLMLRRHEKDFFIRKKLAYRNKFNDRLAQIRKRIHANEEDEELQNCLYLLSQYESSFNEVCDIKMDIGFNIEEAGLQAVIWEKTNKILKVNQDIQQEVQRISKGMLQNLNRLLLIGLVITTAVTVLIVLWLSGLMSKSITKLSFQVNDFVRSDFEGKFESAEFEKRGDEIGDLYQNFKTMSEEVTVHFKNYRENAESKHREIVAKSSKIKEQKELLEVRELMLSSRNKSLMDSIFYAKRIQSALFPSHELLRSILGECILFFNPKDVVSGDFYWVEETKDSIYFAVGDCTGHGVPGAFVSILAYNQLEQAIKHEGFEKPGKVLEFLDEKISYLLNKNQSQEVVNDGMDIILCRFLKKEGHIEYAAANRPLLIMKDNHMTKLSGERKSIGASLDSKNPSFTTNVYIPQPDETLFLTTDGYADQFGGAHDKKIKMNGLLSKLERTGEMETVEAEKYLMRSFLKWKGGADQVDDVCILGVKMVELLAEFSKGDVLSKHRA